MNFHPAVKNWFQQNYESASPPQEKGWPSIAAGRHTLILAPTGSGKTLASFLWCIDDLFRASLEIDEKQFSQNREGVHTLYISPLKALNNDIHRNLQTPLTGIRQAAKELEVDAPEIRTVVRTGDTPSHVRQAMVKRPPHILITTPESLYLLLTSQYGREIFHRLKYLVIDEIHAICSNKRGVHLSLSLERLMPLCDAEPVRIGLSATQKPLERIAAFLGGQTLDETTGLYQKRPVNIVDCGQRKKMDLRVISPLEDYTDLPEATIWPMVIDQLYELITAHRTTLVFVNMRVQAERVARQLNEKHREVTGDDKAELAAAHHGSLSRDFRYDVEARLKEGLIPAVIATGSLELGIDIGSIDLVVQLQAPMGVSAGLQRVGRSGHTLKATSKGRVIPLFRGDLGDCIALAGCMIDGDIEQTAIPENCLDVLAQQIVSEVAQQKWARKDLFNLVRQSYCYRNLTVSLFDSVLNMLAGKYMETPIRPMQAKISWDKVNDVLTGLRGARLTAALQGGTIPDRGLYGVYLADSNTRLGEMDEEFVFESKVGDPFYLGNNEWRIEKITNDRILVSPIAAIQPRAPFWNNDAWRRDYQSSKKIADFRAELDERLDEKHPEKWLASRFPIDEHIAANLVAFFKEQRKHTGEVPTGKTIVCELYRDHANEPHLVVHSPFGGRVNGALAIALSATFEQEYGAETQYSFNDQAILFRLLDTIEPPDIRRFFELTPAEIEALIVRAIADAPIFTVQFRKNAVRSLLLRRSQLNKRIPLWLQRLRAADLLQVVRQYPDFPAIIETYRDCLQDVFDLPALQEVIGKVQAGEIAIHQVKTAYPSPMASGVVFNFTEENLYDRDRARYPGQAAAVSNELLAEILSHQSIPAIVTHEIVEEAQARWRHETPATQAATAEELFLIIEKLGPVSGDALTEESRENPEPWLEELRETNRIVEIDHPSRGWIAVAQEPLFEQPVDEDRARQQVQRFLRTRGPVVLEEIRESLQLPEELSQQILQHLQAEKDIVSGQLIEDDEREFWCDRDNFAELYRRAISARRAAAAPVDRALFYKFIFQWHGLTRPEQDLSKLLQKYSGFYLPLKSFERELLRTRFAEPEGLEKFTEAREHFQGLIKSGQAVLYASRETEEGLRRVCVVPRGEGGLFRKKEDFQILAEKLDENAATVLEFLKENGASFGRDLIEGTGLPNLQVQDGLRTLAQRSLVSADDAETFFEFLQPASAAPTHGDQPPEQPWANRTQGWQSMGRRRPTRHELRQKIQKLSSIKDVRWFLTSSFAAYGAVFDDKERAERQARLLLNRYGVLVKEWYRREKGLLPWPRLFQVLKRLEWQGEIRRGYFIEGLSGVQFALPEAVELLQKINGAGAKIPVGSALVSTADPALPFGGFTDWEIVDREGKRISVTRHTSNHLLFANTFPVVYLENFGQRIWFCREFQEKRFGDLIAALKNWLLLPPNLRPRSKLQVSSIDNVPAVAFEKADVFLENGFEKKGEQLVLWPSAV